jgi:arylsulfatase A
MNRRDFIRNIAAASISSMFLSSCSRSLITEKTLKKPNVLLVLTDDQGYSDVGFHGNPHLKTPNLDKFAANSFEFEQFYVQPVCSPTRACLMTGRYHYRTGVVDTGEGRSLLAADEFTIAEAFKQAGYKTAVFGKWHLGDNYPFRPIDQGFDESLVHIGGMIGAPYNPLDGNAYFDPILVHNGIEKRYAGYCCDIWADRAIDFIDNCGDEPFFVYFATNTPHHPLTVPEKYSRPYEQMGLSVETARYYGMLTNIDDNFGRLINKLENDGLMDNTIVIFMGDNGTSSLHKQPDLYETGLRGRKTYVYENGIRVPFCISCPADDKGGRKIDTIAACIDVMPTLLDLCQVDMPRNVKFDGLSLIPLLSDDNPDWPDRNLYFQWHRGNRPQEYRNIAVRSQRFKLVQPAGRGMEEYTEPLFELYDIKNDPFEQNDLADRYPEIVERMKADYRQWFKDVSSERGFEPLAVQVGTKHENPVILTRQDMRDASTFGTDSGYYVIDIKKPGEYRITCRLADMLLETHPVTLKIGEMVVSKEILYAESQCRFDRVILSKGKCELSAWVEMEKDKQGFRYIIIEKL